MVTRSKTVAAGVLVAAFAAGIAVGGVAAAAWGEREGRERGDHHRRRSYVERLHEELSLAPEQRDSVEVILDRREAEMHALWQEVGPRFDSLRARIRGEILAVLTAEQQERYRALVSRSDSIRDARRQGGRHGK
jgi:Spy/CpxP family protein refolding chaperone